MSAFSMSSMQARFGFGFSSYAIDTADRTPEPPADHNSSRAFVMDMLNRHPDAFASDHDVHSMMLLFPEQF